MEWIYTLVAILWITLPSYADAKDQFSTKITFGGSRVLNQSRSISIIKPISRDNLIVAANINDSSNNLHTQRKLPRVVSSIPREAERTESSEGMDGKVVKLYRSPLGFNCVAYAHSKGFNQTGFKLAKYIKVNSQEPKEGGFVVFNNRPKGHIAYIEKVEGDKITITEGSYYKGWISKRIISTGNSLIKGYVL